MHLALSFNSCDVEIPRAAPSCLCDVDISATGRCTGRRSRAQIHARCAVLFPTAHRLSWRTSEANVDRTSLIRTIQETGLSEVAEISHTFVRVRSSRNSVRLPVRGCMLNVLQQRTSLMRYFYPCVHFAGWLTSPGPSWVPTVVRLYWHA